MLVSNAAPAIKGFKLRCACNLVSDLRHGVISFDGGSGGFEDSCTKHWQICEKIIFHSKFLEL